MSDGTSDGLVPAVRWRDGPLQMSLGSFIAAFLLPPLLVFLSATSFVTHGHRIGLHVVEPVDATVLRTEASGGSRRGCEGQWIHVRVTPSEEGRFRVCDDDPSPGWGLATS